MSLAAVPEVIPGLVSDTTLGGEGTVICEVALAKPVAAALSVKLPMLPIEILLNVANP